MSIIAGFHFVPWLHVLTVLKNTKGVSLMFPDVSSEEKKGFLYFPKKSHGLT